MRIPPYLKKGDTIGIAATARKVGAEELQPAIKAIEANGYNVKLSANIYSEQNQLAGSDKERIRGFQDFIDDPSIKAIICARGGYGTVRMIDHLNFDHFNRRPKWIVGYSDITVLHAHIQQNFGIETIHGLMPLDFPKDGQESIAVKTLFMALEGKNISYEVPANTLNKKGIAAGELVGGNLSILYSLTGTVSNVSTLGRILFIEDLDEYLYHIDRMMMNLKRASMVEGIKALVVGGMTKMNDNTIPYGKTAEEIILEQVAQFDFPVCFGFPSGHINNPLTLILGRRINLKIGEEKVSLEFEQV